MPLYMDIHYVESESFSVKDVVNAHMEDLAVQKRFGVNQIKYWVNEKEQTIFCLMEGPDKESCHKVHQESHGMTACNIIEVSDEEFHLYLGKGFKDQTDLAHTEEGSLDSGFRTLLFLELPSTTDHSISVAQMVRDFDGTMIYQPQNHFTGSFIHAKNAFECACLLSSKLDYAKVILITGKPVDLFGTRIFEETLKNLEAANFILNERGVFLDQDTYSLLQAQGVGSRNMKKVNRVLTSSMLFDCQRIYELIQSNYRRPDFNTSDMSKYLGLSRSQLYRKVRTLSVRTPKQLINDFRLSRAYQSLRMGRSNIAQIAYDTGFNSPGYFSRIFKRTFERLPSSVVQS